MTSNERKIINCLWETKEKTHIRLVAQKANLSSDYARLLCRALARSGHIKFENDLAHLLKKGRSRFSAEGGSASGEENNPAAVAEKLEPLIATANVTLLTDEPAVVSPASDRSDVVRQGSPQEEENQEEGAGEDKDKDKPASSDEELDRVLVDLEPLSQKDEGEEKDKPEEPKDETGNALRELEEEKTEEIAEEPKEEINTDKEEKIEKPDETELKPEPKAEEEKPAVAEAVAGKEKELAEEAKAENPEKVALKKEPAKPSGGFGASFRKIVNWFAEKK